MGGKFHEVPQSVAAVASVMTIAALPAPAQGATEESNRNGGATHSSRRATESSVVNAGWQDFYWDSDSAADVSFTFRIKRAARLTITDVYCRGDAFTVRSGSKILAVTPSVPTVGNCEVSDPDVALRDPSYSSASVIIKPGTYVVSIEATANPYGGGAGFIRIDFPPRRRR